MHTDLRTIFLLASTAITLVACQTAPSPVSSQIPPITSSQTKDGKGIPNGRSDTSAPYWQHTEIKIASDPEYGRTSTKPLRTGPILSRRHILFLNALRGPNGEPVEYERIGACCNFEDKSLPLGGGLLDVYRIKIDGSSVEVLLYVDMYRKGLPEIPVGFTARIDDPAWAVDPTRAADDPARAATFGVLIQHGIVSALAIRYYCENKMWPENIKAVQAFYEKSVKSKFPQHVVPDWGMFSAADSTYEIDQGVLTVTTNANAIPKADKFTSRYWPPDCANPNGKVAIKREIHIGEKQTSEVEHAKAIIQLTQLLEQQPLNPAAPAIRARLMQWAETTNDAIIVICDVMGPIPGTQVPYGTELFVQYALGNAAYQLQHPDSRDDVLKTQMAGIVSLLAAYRSFLQADPHARIPQFDAWLNKQSSGTLEAELTPVIQEKCGN